MINRDLWEIGYKRKAPAPKAAPPAGPKAMGFLMFGSGGLGGLALIGLFAMLWRRRSR